MARRLENPQRRIFTNPADDSLNMLIDTHAHLDWDRFDGERDAVIARAAAAGVDRIITIGCDLESSQAALTLAERYPGVYAAVGIHPCDSQHLDCEGWLADIAELAKHPKAVAIGEIGLDHFHPPRVDGLTEQAYHQGQRDVFQQQLELAENMAMPVIVHQRECLQPILDTVSPFAGRVRCVFHCWTHTLAPALPLIEAGHLISFTGVTTFKNAKEPQQAAQEVPSNAYMVETDSPFLSPTPHRGKRCEPAYVRHTAEHIAQLRGSDLATVAAETTATAETFFGIA